MSSRGWIRFYGWERGRWEEGVLIKIWVLRVGGGGKDREGLGVEHNEGRGGRGPLDEMKSQILNRVAAWRDGPAVDDVSLVLLEIS